MNQEERWRLYERKAVWTKCLGALCAIEPSIGVSGMTYMVDEETDTETVEIQFENGLRRMVDVTADSFLAIMDDVRKVLD